MTITVPIQANNEKQPIVNAIMQIIIYSLIQQMASYIASTRISGKYK